MKSVLQDSNESSSSIGLQELALSDEGPVSSLSGRSDFSLGRVTRQSAINMAGGIVSQGLRFLVVIYVARRFSTADFGLFSFAWAVNAFVLVVSNFGLPVFGCRAIARSGRVSGELLAEICFLRACLALLATGLAIGIVELMPGASRLELMLVAVFSLSNVAQAGLLDWVFQGLQRQEMSAVLNVILQGAWLVLTILGVRLGLGLRSVAVALCASALIASLSGYLLLKRTGLIERTNQGVKPILGRSWRLFGSAAPLGWGTLIVTILVWSDVLVVRSLRGELEVGLYAAGNRAALALAMLGNMYVQGAFSLLSRASSESSARFDRYFRRCYQDMALCFLPGSLWAIFYARDIVLALFGRSEYLVAVPVFQVFLVVFLLTALWNLYGTGAVIAFHRDRDYLRVLAITAMVFVPVCLVLTALGGIQGTSLGVLFTQAFCLLLFMKQSRELVHVKHLSVLVLPALVGLGVAVWSKTIGMSLLSSATLLIFAYAGIAAVRFRATYQTEGAH